MKQKYLDDFITLKSLRIFFCKLAYLSKDEVGYTAYESILMQ